MRRVVWLLGILLLLCQAGWAQALQESLGDAARRVRAARTQRNLSGVRSFDNDNLKKLKGGALSVMRGSSSTASTASTAATAADSGAGGGDECDEQCWRGKFSTKRKQIADAEHEIDILLRELNLSRTQYFKDPNRALQEQRSGAGGSPEMQDLRQRMDAKKTELEGLKRELSDLQNELRASGSPPGWSR